MGLSLVKNHMHITFSTKNRIQNLYSPVADELHAYLGGICNNLECPTVCVGGHFDHVHILCMLSKKIALMDLLNSIKSSSSKWIKTKGDPFRNFQWQSGYGAFCVEQQNVEKIKKYIQHQHEHHKTKTFKEEYLEILKEYEIEYDERYIWD